MIDPGGAVEPGDRPGERIRRRQAISVLRARLRAIEGAWGPGVDRDRLTRYESHVEDRRRRVVELRHQISAARRRLEELHGEQRRAGDELAGVEQALEAALSEAVALVEASGPPSWSPVPVVGYRLWTIDRLALRGARAVWEGPLFEARCVPVPGAVGDVVGVPHTDGRCGRLGCGVYAVKAAAMLIDSGRFPAASRPGAVLGAVALTGKVVEHELGYRGRWARAVAAGALWRDRMVVSDHAGWIGRLFAEPVAALENPPVEALVEEANGRARRVLLAGITEHLGAMASRYQQRFVGEQEQ